MVVEDLGNKTEHRVLPVVNPIRHEVFWTDFVGKIDFPGHGLNIKTPKEQFQVVICLTAAVHASVKNIIRVVNGILVYRALPLTVYILLRITHLF